MNTNSTTSSLGSNNSEYLRDKVIAFLSDAKAEDVVQINLLGKSSVADFMIIATGRSQRQVKSISQRIREMFKSNGVREISVEGEQNSDWILVDVGDLVIHLFRPEVREFYNLEKMWSAEMPSDDLSQIENDGS
tara:strand:- start:8124 stop:8525 length:402 start_codon:yes stop_codon:yes gene_type:complete